jgi:penicillin amidase
MSPVLAGLETALPRALAQAWTASVRQCGPDPAAWRWNAVHHTAAKHTLLARFPERAAELNPPPVQIGGDGDTLQAASYLYGDRPDFWIVGLSVYRQVVDFSQSAGGELEASYVVPGGVSGVPGSPHFADQLERWRTHQRIPMPHREAAVRAATVETLALRPT